MVDYLSLRKVFKDGVALIRAHYLYILVLISAVIIPYSLLITMENIPDGIIFIIPFFIIILMMVEIISTLLASSSYVDMEFIIIDEIKKSFFRSFTYLFLTILAGLATFLGLSAFVVPGILVNIFFNILKVDYIVNKNKLGESFKSSLSLLSQGSILKIVKLYLFPLAIQFILAIFISPFLNPNSLEEDLLKLYPYMSGALVILFPITICFKTALYYNLLKFKLQTTNQLV